MFFKKMKKWGKQEEILDLDDPQYILKNMQSLLASEQCEIRNGALLLPQWRVTVRPEIAQLKEQSAVLNFYVDSPDWDRRLFECSAALGSDRKQALGMAEGGFLFGMLDGISAMVKGKHTDRLETVFDGSIHRWSMYQSNVVGMGDSPQENEVSALWRLLREGIAQRIGNQKICCVKVYGAKNGDSITGECRINDTVSPELSGMVADYVREWNTQGFGSQKQFFFLKQEEETYTPYPYSEEQLAGFTRQAIQLYRRSAEQGSYEDYYDALLTQLDDHHLAEELYSFLPEMCAEHAFTSLSYPESFSIHRGETDITVYKSQLASYYPIQNALLHELGGDEFTDELYKAFIAVSSVYSVICSAKEQGADLLANGGRIYVSCGFSQHYLVR
ncbi:MAG: hypothetical protein K0Q90_4218 [Paenibacillaceae bacterium]|jgi:hypothetical protein|nr:hypothetical protein [Paenibacillaceae bacterium]